MRPPKNENYRDRSGRPSKATMLPATKAVAERRWVVGTVLLSPKWKTERIIDEVGTVDICLRVVRPGRGGSYTTYVSRFPTITIAVCSCCSTELLSDHDHAASTACDGCDAAAVSA